MAPDAVGGVNAVDVAAYLAAGWSAARVADEITVHPMSTGADGLCDVVRATLGGDLQPVLGLGPRGQPLPATWLRCGTTYYLETGSVLGSSAQADAGGLATAGTSAGVGVMLAAAVAAGARTIVVGLGPAGVHDAGIGALRALADAGPEEPLEVVVARATAILRGVDLLVAASSDIPLVGLSGAGAALATRPGIDSAAAQQIESSLGRPIAQIEAASKRPASLLTAESGNTAGGRRPSRAPYSGCGGGVAFALACVGARVMPGAVVVAAQTGLAAAVASCDLAVTVCDVLDGDALAVGVPGEVGRLSLQALVPTVAAAGTVLLSRREISGTGVEAMYPIHDPVSPSRTANRPPALPLPQALSQRASRVARTWSR